MNQGNNSFNPNSGILNNNQDEYIEYDFQNEGEEQEQLDNQMQYPEEQEINEEMLENNNNQVINNENEEKYESNNPNNIEEDFKLIEQEDNNNENMMNNEIINSDENNNNNNNQINNYINQMKDINTLSYQNSDKNMKKKNVNINMNMKNNQFFDDGEEQLIENTNNNEIYDNQNIDENNNNFENENENGDENYEEGNMEENEEENEEEIENNQILQEIDEYILNNENVDEVMKNFIANVKNKLINLIEENNQLKIYNYNLINSNQENIFLKSKISKLQAMTNKYKTLLSQKSNIIDTKGEILRLNSKINQYELALSKSNMEKKLLESRLDNFKKDFSRELSLMNNLKNNELQSYQKRLNEMKKNEFKSTNDFNLSKRMFELKIKEDSKFYGDRINNLQEKNDQISNENIALDEENKNLKNIIQKKKLNIKYQDGIIKNMNEKMKEISNDYKAMIDSLAKNNDRSQFLVKKLFMENDLLKRENQMIILEMNKLRENLADDNFEKKEINKILDNYRNKLNKYKMNIIKLKQRINELLQKNDQNKIDNEYNNLMRYKSSMNFFHQ